MTIVSEVARARAPAFTVNPRFTMAFSIRSRVSREMERLPDSAYETVLRETPAARATSPIVAIVLLVPFRTGSMTLLTFTEKMQEV